MAASGDFNEESAIGNTRTDHIYSASFPSGAGKFFNVVFEEDGSKSIEYSPPFPSRNRIKVTVTFLKDSNNISKVVIKKFKEYKAGWQEEWSGPSEPLSFTHFTFEKVLAFLKLLSELDLVNFSERRLALHEQTGAAIDDETAAKLKAILSKPDGANVIDQLLRSGAVTSRDLVNIGYRKQQIEVFASMLADGAAVTDYATRAGISTLQPEKAWQHFFHKNQWIFGLGLDYRFLSILSSEAHLGDADVAGRGSPVGDYLGAFTNFTVLVEVKRPDTELFQKRSNRAGSWQLSSDLIGAVSQILEQKASWQVKGSRPNFDETGAEIAQRTVDPKSILIVGSNDRFGAGNDKERDIKLRTFEPFRRDSRNIEILTYDELFERAQFIVGRSDHLEQTPEDAASPPAYNEDDIPF